MKRKVKRRGVPFPLFIEAWLALRYVQVSATMIAVLRREIGGLVASGDVTTAGVYRAIAQAEIRWWDVRLYNLTLESWLVEAAGKVFAFTARVQRRLLGDDFVEVGRTTRQVDDVARAWIVEELERVSALPAAILELTKARLLDVVGAGGTTSDLEVALTLALGLGEGRAKLQAVNAIGTLNARMARAIQLVAGVERYQWATVLDERVRPTHQALEGEVFSWQGEPEPPEGHPGEPVNCRCWALPVPSEAIR